jgi:endonuclease I
MKKWSILFLFLSWIGTVIAFNKPVTLPEALPIYYEAVDGKSGKDLFNAIQKVAKVGYRTTDFRYDSVWLAFKYTDIRPDGYIWEIYSDCVFEYEKDRTSNTSQTGECKGYNREHAMCQSWFGTKSLAGKEMSSSKKNSPGSDIFHIYPASYGMNSRRGNRPYGEVQTAANTSGNGTKYGSPVTTMSVANSVAGAYVEGKITLSTNVLEPADEYKGDIARSYFGTMVKWAGEWAFNMNENGRVIFDATIDADTHYAPENNYGLTDYGLAMLLKWHRQDPVSQKEVDRNNGIQRTQGNRNPFIDYPYLVEYIWGEKSGDILDLDELLCSADVRFELGISNGYLDDTDVDVIVDTVFWMVGNSVYSVTPIRHGGKVNKLPQSPEACSEASDAFMGWTDKPIVAMSEEAPHMLYRTAVEVPEVNGNTRYYAVFAEQLSTGIQVQNITLNANSLEGWTLNDVKSSSNNSYWILSQNASIVSPQINMNQLDSIVMQLRTYYNYGTIQITADGEKLTTLTATSSSMSRYICTLPQSDKIVALTFTGVDCTATRGVGVEEIVIHTSAGEVMYSNYLTHCDEDTQVEYVKIDPNGAHKIMLNGQLYIQIDGQLYDSLGRVVR